MTLIMDAFVTMQCDRKVPKHFLFERNVCHIVLFQEVLAWERFLPRLERKEGLQLVVSFASSPALFLLLPPPPSAGSSGPTRDGYAI